MPIFLTMSVWACFLAASFWRASCSMCAARCCSASTTSADGIACPCLPCSSCDLREATNPSRSASLCAADCRLWCSPSSSCRSCCCALDCCSSAISRCVRSASTFRCNDTACRDSSLRSSSNIRSLFTALSNMSDVALIFCGGVSFGLGSPSSLTAFSIPDAHLGSSPRPRSHPVMSACRVLMFSVILSSSSTLCSAAEGSCCCC
mmetsp:Transcript_6783/g.15904  ORF Transcript_6783/g.15904 Transcript_6783/m.15904 type:complete len:205 (-) Transcript_6783:144-758(-)